VRIIKREELKREKLPGRIIQDAVGKDACSRSTRMTMGFGLYSEESGPMEPHQHAEEIIYILSAKDSWVRHGSSRDQLGSPIPLQSGMTLHFPELEWHVFEYDEGGHVDLIFFYGQVDNIRPEEIMKTRNSKSL
jgi:hypothetical protein